MSVYSDTVKRPCLSMNLKTWCLMETGKLSETSFSCTPDRDFRCFYPCEIFLSHIPVTALGKDKKRIAACHPHAGGTSLRDVIVMLKWSHHVASQRIQNYLEDFSCLCNIK